METEIYRQQDYPKPVLAKLKAMPPLAITIANRWMRGWPKAVKMHLKSGEYLGFLKEQEEKERRALADPTTHHLAHHEIAELYDLSPKPPMPGP
jgi:hypothetical protein